MPIIETEIAAAVKEETSQTINWKLCKQYQLSVEQNFIGGLTKPQGGRKRKWR